MWLNLFYRQQFRKLSATYGSRLDLWPRREKGPAQEFILKKSKEARHDQRMAVALDAALETLRPKPLSDDSLWQALSLVHGPMASHGRIYDFNSVLQPVETPFETPAQGLISEAGFDVREERVLAVAKAAKKQRARRKLNFS